MSNKKLPTLKIDYKRWGQNAMLSAETDKMCCLGFCARTLGHAPKELAGMGSPADTIENSFAKLDDTDRRAINRYVARVRRWPESLVKLQISTGVNEWYPNGETDLSVDETDTAAYLMQVNDTEKLDATPAIRMALIAKRFKKHGTTVTFTNVPKDVRAEYNKYMKDRRTLVRAMTAINFTEPNF